MGLGCRASGACDVLLSLSVLTHMEGNETDVKHINSPVHQFLLLHVCCADQSSGLMLADRLFTFLCSQLAAIAVLLITLAAMAVLLITLTINDSQLTTHCIGPPRLYCYSACMLNNYS